MIGERLEVVRIVAGVAFHALGQRAQGPVGFLRAFLELHTEIFLHQMAQAELAQAKQSRCKHGIENGFGDELVMFAQQTQIVIRAVHDQLVTG